MTRNSHRMTVPCNKCDIDIVSVKKLDVGVMDSLEQFGDLLLPWNDCVM